MMICASRMGGTDAARVRLNPKYTARVSRLSAIFRNESPVYGDKVMVW
jgi:hypothetical protein